jgi:hypothetical protein
MKASFLPPDFDLDDRVVIYRVRVWTPPTDSTFAWALDDWEIEGARSVTEVLHWAEAEAKTRPFEIFARTMVSTPWIRIHGELPDNSEQRIEVPLSLDQ